MKKLPFAVGNTFWYTAKYWDQYETIIHQGGTSSGKTYGIMQWLILQAIATPQCTITIAGQDMPNLRVGAHRDFLTILNKAPELKDRFVNWRDGTAKNKFTFTLWNGTTMEFKSFGDAQDAKSGKRWILFVNEANGIDFDTFSELADRTYGKVIIDFNPTAKFWAHTELMPDPTCIRIITNYEDNPWCPQKIIDKLLRYKEINPATGKPRNEHRWRVYGMGLTGQVEGAIYTNIEWIKPNEYPNIHNLRRFGYGCDYGYVNDPFAFVSAGMYMGRIYARGLIYSTGLKTSNVAELWDMMGVDPFDVIAMDESQAKEQADVLRNTYGYNIKMANRRAGSIVQGIELLQDYPLFIVADENWQNEADAYVWDKNAKKRNKNLPVDKENHYWDALRYWGLEMLAGDNIIDEYEEQAW